MSPFLTFLSFAFLLFLTKSVSVDPSTNAKVATGKPIAVVNNQPKTKKIYPDYYTTYTSFPIGKQEKKFQVSLPKIGSLDIFQVFSKVGSMGGWVFLGLQLYNHLKHLVIKSEGQVTESESSSSVLMASIQKLEKDHEELWRIVHSLHKTQGERLDTTEAQLSELRQLVKEQQQQQLTVVSKVVASVSELSTGVTGAMERLDKMSAQTSSLESTLSNLEKELELLKSTISTVVTISDVEAILKTRLQSLESEVQKLRETDLPLALREHDEIVLQKLKKFGDSIHKLVQTKLQSSASSTKKAKK